MSWEKVPIKDVCEGIYDGPHATPPLSESGAIFLGIQNFKNGRLDFSDVRYISEEDLLIWTKRVIPQAGDIVFSYEATLNLYAIIPAGFRGCLGRRMALIRVDKNKINYRYLYYYLHSPTWKAVIAENTVTGATVDRIPLIRFPDFEIELPPLDVQNNIADILSAYDDLIENNQRQIKLLEEAAMRLYREWFVFMRFPGYESVRIVDGVPEGWRQGYLSDIIVNVGMPASKDDRDSFEYYLPIDCLPNKSLALEEVSDISNAQSSLISFNEGDILFGAMRPYFHKVLPSPVKGLTRGTCFVISPKEIHYYSYVLMLLFSEETIRYATTVSVGTTMPYVRWSDFVQMKVTIPGEDIVIKFNELIQPIIASLKKYFFMNRNLRIVRDALLPRLMNGGEGLKLEGGAV